MTLQRFEEPKVAVVDIRLPVDPGAVAEARAALSELEGRVSFECLENVRLLVSELVTNSIRHGPTGSAAVVGLRVELEDSILRAEVEDGGSGFAPRLGPAADGMSGWGLVLVSKLADRWGVHPGPPTRVWFEMDGYGSRQNFAPGSRRGSVESSELGVALAAGRIGIWTWDLTTGVIGWSESLELIHGLEPGRFGGTFEDFQRDIHPEDRERVMSAIRDAVDHDAEYALDYRIVRADGEIRWLGVRGEVSRDGEGRAVRMSGVCSDVTERKEADRALEVQYAVARVLSDASSVDVAAPALIRAIAESLRWELGALWLVLDAEDGEVLRFVGGWHDPASDLDSFLEASHGFEFRRGDGLPGRIWDSGQAAWIADVAAVPRLTRAPVATVEGLHAAFVFPVTLGDKVTGVLEFFSERVREPDQAVLDLVGAVGRQIGQFVAQTQARLRLQELRVRLLENERAAREAAEAARERMTFLADASVLLSSSLDYRRTLAKVARLAVPRLADWCSVDVLEPDGHIQSVAVAHVDPSKAEIAREYRDRFPPMRDDPGGLADVIRTGRSELWNELPDQLVEQAVIDPEHRRFLRELGLRSAMLVPLTARQRPFGAITLASAESGRRFTEADLELAEDLARRAAVAIDNARLYEERSRVARTLQRTLLPRVLPEIPGVEVAAFHQPAGVMRSDVGGDFYDVFEAGDGAWGIAIGDVCGKGVEAAAVTGLARHALRAAALGRSRPSSALADLNEVLRREEGDRFCTVAFGRLDEVDGRVRLTLALGGHPLPLVMGRDGTVTTTGTPGSLLGVFEDLILTDTSVELTPGDAVMLYTDGLLDTRWPLGMDERALSALLASCTGMDAGQIADRIRDAVTDLRGEAPDDTAVLILRVTD
jgi:PAS domain S-box-containing protein